MNFVRNLIHLGWWQSLPPWAIGNSIGLMCDITIYPHTHIHMHTHTDVGSGKGGRWQFFLFFLPRPGMNPGPWYSEPVALPQWPPHTQTYIHTQTHSCTSGTEEDLNKEQLLFIGGINPFLVTDQNFSRFTTTDFVGAIRNAVIGHSQVNFRCPLEEENTLIGNWIYRLHLLTMVIGEPIPMSHDN